MKGVLTLYALFAFYSVACGEVVDLDNSNFDQVMHFLLCGSLCIHHYVAYTVCKWRQRRVCRILCAL